MNPLDSYSPLDLLKRPLTIFNYEVKRLRWKPDVRDLPREDWARVWVAFRMIILLGSISLLLTRVFGLELAFVFAVVVFVGPWLFSFGVDLYTVTNVVTFWRTRAQGEPIDLLRLTMPTDADLLNSLRGVAELSVWRGMRWEIAIRAIIAILGVILCAAYLIALLLGLLRVNTMRDLASFAVGICMIIWFLRLLFLHIREPLWRMRTLVALSIALTTRTRDATSAILIASGIVLGLKLVQIAVAVVLMSASINLFNANNIRNNMLLTGAILIAGSIFVPLLVRLAYKLIHTYCTWLTIRTMQGAEG